MTHAVTITKREVLSRAHGLLERIWLSRRRYDGTRQTFNRDVYDTGDGAAILLYDSRRGRVLLVKQFRLPPYLSEGLEDFIEVCAGKLDGLEAEERIVKEVLEETGYEIEAPRFLFEAFMSPGSYAEKLSFFVAPYAPANRTGRGGGHDDDEDIEILEPTFEEALAMIERGEIVDAKTILLLHYAQFSGLMRA